MATRAADAGTAQRLDAIVEADLVTAKKIVKVPMTIRQQCIAEGMGDLPTVRLVRMTPARRGAAAELVQRKYFKDLQDESLPSESQIRALAAKRGEWTAEHDTRFKTLSEESQQLMLGLYADGFGKGAERWTERITELSVSLRELIDDAHPQRALFEEWRDYVAPAVPVEGGFSPDSALQQLFDAAPEAADLLEELDELKDKVNRYWKLVGVRAELNQLELKRSKVFDQTIEARRDQMEELARLYVTSARVAESGEELGPLAPTFDGLMEFPFEVLQFLTSEAYLFQNGLPDVAREYLETFGFLEPASDPSSKDVSDESPDEATPSSGGDAAPTAPESSSASELALT
jgi:hypothetical protein